MALRDSKGRFIKYNPLTRVNLICPICKNEFKILPHEVKEGRKYCSQSCSNKIKRIPRGNLRDDQKYWTSEKKRILFNLWEFHPKKEILKYFPNKSWAAISSQIVYMKERDKLKIPARRKTNAWKYEREICELYRQGIGSIEIAIKFKIIKQSVLRILRENGIERRSNSEAQKLSSTSEKRRKHSEFMKQRFKENPELSKRQLKNLNKFFDKNPNFRSEKMKAWIALPANRKRFVEIMKIKSNTPENRERQRNVRMRQVFPLVDAKTTEIPIQNELHRRAIKFNKHFLVFNKDKRPIRPVDIAFPEIKLAVECDGDYWHGNTDIFKILNQMQIKRIETDKNQDKQITEQGWTILRFWESDIQSNVQICVDIIEEMIKEKKKATIIKTPIN